MTWRTILKSETTVWVVVGAAVAAATVVSFKVFGWLGIGLIGLLGLLISIRQELFGDHAVIDADHGSGAVPLLDAQLRGHDMDASPEARMRRAARKARSKKVTYLVNTIFIAMAMFGIGLYFTHGMG